MKIRNWIERRAVRALMRVVARDELDKNDLPMWFYCRIAWFWLTVQGLIVRKDK